MNYEDLDQTQRLLDPVYLATLAVYAERANLLESEETKWSAYSFVESLYYTLIGAVRSNNDEVVEYEGSDKCEYYLDGQMTYAEYIEQCDKMVDVVRKNSEHWNEDNELERLDDLVESLCIYQETVLQAGFDDWAGTWNNRLIEKLISETDKDIDVHQARVKAERNVLIKLQVEFKNELQVSGETKAEQATRRYQFKAGDVMDMVGIVVAYDIDAGIMLVYDDTDWFTYAVSEHVGFYDGERFDDFLDGLSSYVDRVAENKGEASDGLGFVPKNADFPLCPGCGNTRVFAGELCFDCKRHALEVERELDQPVGPDDLGIPFGGAQTPEELFLMTLRPQERERLMLDDFEIDEFLNSFDELPDNLNLKRLARMIEAERWERRG